MPKDFSYGVIPVYKGEGGTVSVLLVAKGKKTEKSGGVFQKDTQNQPIKQFVKPPYENSKKRPDSLLLF